MGHMQWYLGLLPAAQGLLPIVFRGPCGDWTPPACGAHSQPVQCYSGFYIQI